MRTTPALLCAVTCALAAWAPPGVLGQPARGTRKATTVAALGRYPLFFHTQTVRVRGAIEDREGVATLVSDDRAIALVGSAAADAPRDQPVEATALFVDVGRLEPDDPRLTGTDVAARWQQRTGRTWPGVNELPLLIAQRVGPAEPFPAPSVRALALDPARYQGQSVTVAGRFRGFNLFGDLPDAPRPSRHAFVLQFADAAVWVLDLQPRGDGFRLDPRARIDTGRWLEVTGTVALERDHAILMGQSVRLATPPAETPEPAEAAAVVGMAGPRPEVLFSLPAEGETEVAPTTRVRAQFSRGLDPGSIEGNVRVGYTSGPPGAPEAPPIVVTATYDQGNRVLELRFSAPLELFRTVRVELGEGIRATDGAALVRWTLTFTTGG